MALSSSHGNAKDLGEWRDCLGKTSHNELQYYLFLRMIHGDGIILTGHSELQYYLFLSMIHGDGIILTDHSELQYYLL